MPRVLYRGVNAERYAATGGQLIPKTTAPFPYVFRHDGAIRHDGSATYGKSVQNAVLRHELRQEAFPTSGVSTTPHWSRARFYALEGGRSERGYIITIARDTLANFAVMKYIVSQCIPHPSVPEDDEVILVSTDFSQIPAQLVVAITEVRR